MKAHFCQGIKTYIIRLWLVISQQKLFTPKLWHINSESQDISSQFRIVFSHNSEFTYCNSAFFSLRILTLHFANLTFCFHSIQIIYIRTWFPCSSQKKMSALQSGPSEMDISRRLAEQLAGSWHIAFGSVSHWAQRGVTMPVSLNIAHPGTYHKFASQEFPR